ncbi:UNKNOWN [Stylonychia lemnae]|uniref:WKF domain-containing protein n=1 Tax=Stylonychia lemnae TaxID=5949 RepID=A0A078AKD3_STYLE|nr:UNKNOWN [Stylonychia lemnae]|eukprot:CDW82845.1 UNKNOWN [Stylonychia lemnae]
MSKKSRKQRERKRKTQKEEEKAQPKKYKPEELKEKENNRHVRNDSLNYLVLWKENHEVWKFKKSRQVFLFKNMYNVEKVPTKHFKILKKYIKAMQGQQKEKILEEALAIIEKPQEKIVFDDIEKSQIDQCDTSVEKQKMQEQLLQSKLKRAEKIAKCLSKE